jgi:hypothetical protein
MSQFRDIDRPRRPLWETGEYIGYAFDHVEDEEQGAELLEALARWIAAVDFAASYVDPVTPYAGNPRCHGLARRAWAGILLSFHLIENRLRRFRDTLPTDHPAAVRVHFLSEELESLHVDLICWIVDDPPSAGAEEQPEWPPPSGPHYDA